MSILFWLRLAGAGFVLWLAFHFGQIEERDKVNAAVIRYQEREDKALAALETKQAQTKVIEHERIQIVRQQVGDCLDERLPGPLLGSLRNDAGSR